MGTAVSGAIAFCIGLVSGAVVYGLARPPRVKDADAIRQGRRIVIPLILVGIGVGAMLLFAAEGVAVEPAVEIGSHPPPGPWISGSFAAVFLSIGGWVAIALAGYVTPTLLAYGPRAPRRADGDRRS